MIGELTLPRLGETMETGRVAAWLKQPGDAFRRGETLVEIETDKTVVEMPALADGVLHEIVVPAGADADVGAVLCRYEDGRATTATQSKPDQGGVATAQVGRTASGQDENSGARTQAEAKSARQDRGSEARPRSTPLARSIARRQGVALEGVVGSGRRGRIEARDVRASPGSREPSSRSPGMQELGSTDQSGHVERRDWNAVNARGPRIVLLHGLAADVQSWSGLASALMRAGRSATAIDLPGHGATEIDAATIEDAVSAAVSLLERLGGEPVELVGHSFGAAVAVRTARRLPARVRRLTLLAPIGLDRTIDAGFVRDIARVRAGGALAHLLRRLTAKPAPLSSTQLDTLAAELARGRLEALAESLVDEGGQQVDITADLRALAMPARVVWGLQDRIIPWTQVSQVGSRCAIHLIADAGHVPHWDQPAEVAALFD